MSRKSRFDDQFIELTARLSIAPATWLIITTLSFITISVRADMRDLTGGRAVLYVGMSVLVLPIVMLITDSVARKVQPVPWKTVILAASGWILVGLCRILVESLLVYVWNVEHPTIGWNVYAAQLFVPAIWAMILGFSSALNMQIVMSISSHDQLVERLKMTTKERWERLSVERQILASQVAEFIKPQIARISELLEVMSASAPSEALREEVTQVAEQSRDLVRRSAREVADLAQRRQDLAAMQVDPPERTVHGLWPSKELQPPWRSAPMASSFALIVTMIPIAFSSGVSTLYLTSAVLVLTVIVNYLLWVSFGKLVMRVSKSLSLVLIIVVNVFSPGLSYVVLTFGLLPVSNFNFSPRLPFAVISMIVLAGMMMTLAQIWSRDRKELESRETIISELNQQLQELESDTRLEYERVCLQSAKLLHGPIQGRLAAVAMSLAISDGAGREVQIETVAACRVLLDACLSDLDHMMQADRTVPVVEVGLRELRRQWRGLLEIQWTLNPDIVQVIDSDPDARARVAEFIGECATNASRHGAARRLEVSGILAAAGNIELTVRDDGCGPSLPVVPGSGLGLLGEEGETWSIGPNPDGGCVVSLRLASH